MAHPSMNGLVFPRPNLHGDQQVKTLKPRELCIKTLNLIVEGLGLPTLLLPHIE